MIITKEQQQYLLDKYIQENHNPEECYGFVDGMNEAFKLVDKLLKSSKKQTLKNQ